MRTINLKIPEMPKHTHFKFTFLLFSLLSFFIFNCYAQETTTTEKSIESQQTDISDVEIKTEVMKDDDPPFRFVDEIPEFIGGTEAMLTFIQENLKYPANPSGKRINGQVFLEFVIEKDGSISNVKVLVGINPDLDAEAVRVVKMMPKWKPGKRKGQPVRCLYSIPIRLAVN